MTSIWIKLHDAVNDLPAMINLARVSHITEEGRGRLEIHVAEQTFTIPMTLAKFDGELRQAAALSRGAPVIILEL